MILTATAAASAEPLASTAAEEDSLFDLSIEELVDVQVTSVAGVASDWFATPAALTVVTGEQLRRSGLTTLAEALRLVPGMHIGRVDSRQWAVTARGFSNLFSNNLQVVIDGRVVYNQLFGGVFWDVQDPLLEDIDRIEVIRGPGATLWGANAVNGVVNVITKSTEETVGNYVGGGGGNEERGFVGLRHGGKVDDRTSYRIWGRYVDRDSSEKAVDGQQRADDWRLFTGGAQAEWKAESGVELLFQGQAHTSNGLGQAIPLTATTALQGNSDSNGGHVLARVSKSEGPKSRWTFQAYYDVESRRSVDGFDDRRDTYDVDFRHQAQLFSRHEVVWGLGYRHRRSDTSDSATLGLSPQDRNTHLVTGFVQDTVTLVEDRLFVMIGTKLEHNDFTGVEVQPSGRLWWTPDERTTLWAAISRPVRIPTLVESDLVFTVAPGVTLRGDRNIDSETLVAYELGVRRRVRSNVMIDVAAFFNDHDDLIYRSPAPGGDEVFDNAGGAHSYGVEVSAVWQVLPQLSLEGSYSFFHLKADNKAGQLVENGSPSHQFQIHSKIDLTERLGLDAAVYYVSRVSAFRIDSYVRLDLGATWRPCDWLELAVFGQNLIDDSHAEFFQSGRVDTQPEIERGVYGRAVLRF